MGQGPRMDPTGSVADNRRYYDAFAERYEARRGGNDPGGYHELLDVLETDLVERYGRGGDVLEVGCGTGLLLARIERFARRAVGVDLSPGMLARARERGLEVSEGSATALPFADATFDVTCAFKVLAHVPDVASAIREMVRVTRPGGTILAELYNPWSWRGLLKRLGPAGRVAANAHESDVYTRFDSPSQARRYVPEDCKLVGARGIRIVTPTAHAMAVPGLRAGLRALERRLCDTPLRVFGGFYVLVIRKRT
ncbi:MAG: class I SAM-dependent methyltransferase [Polyangiaceae bacterium]|nr:class I SAM-dependent methyltransferase [Polyangiaceae bacterium]